MEDGKVKATATQKQQADKFIIRFPDGMRDMIRERAAANRRTMTGEILVLIERGLKQKEP